MLRYVQNREETINNLLNNNRVFNGTIYFKKMPNIDLTDNPVILSIAGDETIDVSNNTVYRKVGGNATITLINLKEMQEILIFMENLGTTYNLTFVATGLTIRSQIPHPFVASINTIDIYSIVKIGTNLIITTAQGYS